MALTVENGTGIGTADAFVSLADCGAYHTAYQNAAWGTAAEADQEAAIRRATDWISNYFHWKGYRVRGRDQALEWPRTSVYDRNQWLVASNTVPREVVNATCEAALLELTAPGTLTPVITMTDRVRSEKVGDIAVEYIASTRTSDARPRVSRISDMLRGLTRGADGYSGRATR